MKRLFDSKLLGALLAFSGWVALAPAAHAADSDGERTLIAEQETEEEEAGRNILSAKLAYLQIVIPAEEEAGEPEGEAAEDEVLRRAGISISYERVFIPGWLEAELTVLFAPGEGGLTLPVDLVVKKPFEFSEHVEAFVGLGLATEWFEAGVRENAYGLGTQLGGHYWLDSHFAIAIEGEYNLLLHPETAHEVVLAGGAAYRF
jgi:hypothetical protein